MNSFKIINIKENTVYCHALPVGNLFNRILPDVVEYINNEIKNINSLVLGGIGVKITLKPGVTLEEAKTIYQNSLKIKLMTKELNEIEKQRKERVLAKSLVKEKATQPKTNIEETKVQETNKLNVSNKEKELSKNLKHFEVMRIENRTLICRETTMSLTDWHTIPEAVDFLKKYAKDYDMIELQLPAMSSLIIKQGESCEDIKRTYYVNMEADYFNAGLQKNCTYPENFHKNNLEPYKNANEAIKAIKNVSINLLKYNIDGKNVTSIFEDFYKLNKELILIFAKCNNVVFTFNDVIEHKNALEEKGFLPRNEEISNNTKYFYRIFAEVADEVLNNVPNFKLPLTFQNCSSIISSSYRFPKFFEDVYHTLASKEKDNSMIEWGKDENNFQIKKEDDQSTF